MRWWERSLGGPVRGRIIALLRRKERSVEELAEELGVTDNAVRAQLTVMEREGVVQQAGVRHTGAVGKPAMLYAIRPAAASLFSTAYAPTLRALLQSLESRMSAKELEALFEDVGRRLAGGDAPGAEPSVHRRRDDRSLEARAQDAARVLTALGAEIDVERTRDGMLLRGHACPLSEAVRQQPGVCKAITQLVIETTGAHVEERCQRSRDEGGPMRCCFEIRRTA